MRPKAEDELEPGVPSGKLGLPTPPRWLGNSFLRQTSVRRFASCASRSSRFYSIRNLHSSILGVPVPPVAVTPRLSVRPTRPQVALNLQSSILPDEEGWVRNPVSSGFRTPDPSSLAGEFFSSPNHVPGSVNKPRRFGGSAEASSSG